MGTVELLEQVRQLRAKAETALQATETLEALEEVRRQFLGRKGELNAILRSLAQLPPDERRRIGAEANALREWLEDALRQREGQLRQRVLQQRLAKERLDVTLPGRFWMPGGLHPLTLTINEICAIFTDLGFEVVDGPEVEDEWHNFIALNIPPDHPARDDHDSFYITDEMLLRTETSAVQIRTMESRRPPVRIVSPGRVYRRDPFDRTHSPAFHQVEGLLVDEEVTFADLKGTLYAFAQRFFGEWVDIRFRPHHFPFTEPSAEVLVSCVFCKGSGCPVCKQTGWLEVLGCGMVHPAVLENVGYDPERWQGYAFGMGVERLAMLRYGIDDIRIFYENDLRFLRQFD
jgi:phenylalanyl-tRNA synthetase alpha chain